MALPMKLGVASLLFWLITTVQGLVPGHACQNISCPRGSVCEVDQRTNQTYCDPSCLVDNGGCNATDICSIVKRTCVESPCPSIVQCRQCELGGADVVFVLDTSNSIRPQNWPFMINFTASVARFLDIGLNDSLMGMILFGRGANIHFNIRQYLDQDSLVEAILGTEYNASIGTRTWRALNLLRESSQPNGAMMLREGFPHIAVVITDGRSQNHTLTNIAAQRLHDANIFDQISAVGIGNNRRINREELRQIASDPSLAYFLNDFEESLFIELQQNISQQVCNISCEGAVCPAGSQCEVNQTALQAYCQPSCDLDNGGCSDDQICSLKQVTCESYPCPPAVQCLTCEDVNTCPTGEQCKINQTSRSTYCEPTCDLDNGGCTDDEVCSLLQPQSCTNNPCLPVVQCTACENITINCSRGSQCKVDETVHQAYCEVSCDFDNGGCADNEVCSLQQQNCTNRPCPSVVECLNCENITINCSRGSQCKVDESVHQAYCEPSCDLDNGGCADNQICLLQQVTCVSAPCPPVVQCIDSVGCENVTCPRGSQCKTNQTTSQAYCEASCDLDNGGCADDEVCSLQQQQTCPNGSCPLVIQCSSCDNITINCPRGSQCKVDETVHQAYCEASCDLDNGGCANDEVCSLSQPTTCADPPCPPVVQCTACEDIINCSRGSQCKVDVSVHQAYCEASCDLDNGGCADDRVCSLQRQTCTNGPCLPVVECSTCENITINCPRGSQCKVDETVHQAYCEASCDLNNGGCADNEVCSLLEPITCTNPPCPSRILCAGCDNFTCPRGTYCRAALGELYCQPSCEVDNGGCRDDQICTVQQRPCAPSPDCLPNITVQCEEAACTNATCPKGSVCRVDRSLDLPHYCEPSCSVDNGGCPADRLCSLMQVPCLKSPCLPVVQCRGCELGGADVVFVLDASHSIRPRNWPFIINFTASIARFLDIGLNDSLMGVILFGRRANIHFNVRQHLNQTSLVEAVTNIGYNSSIGTRTWRALNLLRESSQPNGTMMLREGVPHIAVVITDGRSQNRTLTNIAAQQLHDANTFDQVYAVGIGRSQIDVDELKGIASDDSLVYLLEDFEESLFIELQQNLTHRVCPLSCDGADCPRGSQCKIDQTTRQTYCEASCDLDNGGCTDSQKCALINNMCTSNLCNDLPIPECSTGAIIIDDDDDDGLSGGIIALIVILCVLLVCCCCCCCWFIIFFVVKRRRKDKEEDEDGKKYAVLMKPSPDQPAAPEEETITVTIAVADKRRSSTSSSSSSSPSIKSDNPTNENELLNSAC